MSNVLIDDREESLAKKKENAPGECHVKKFLGKGIRRNLSNTGASNGSACLK